MIVEDAAQITIGQRIRIARQRARLTQRELADRLGVDKNTISNWETGSTSPERHLGAIRAELDLDNLDEPRRPPQPSVQVREDPTRMTNRNLWRRIGELLEQLAELYAEAERRFFIEESRTSPPRGDVRAPLPPEAYGPPGRSGGSHKA